MRRAVGLCGVLALSLSLCAPASAAGPALALTKTHIGNFVDGQPGDYTLTLANTGTAATSGVITIVDTLPAGLSFTAGTGTGWTCTVAGQIVTCTSSTPLPAGSVDPLLDLKILVSPTAPGSVVNTATASGGSSTNTATATDPTTIVPAPPNLSLTKSHTGNFTVGQVATYTLAPGNNGGSATSGTVTVVDTLPNGLTFNSSSGAGWSCSAAGQVVTCTSAQPIAKGASAPPISLNVNVGTAAVPAVINNASAFGGGAPNTPTATDPTTVIGAPVLGAAKAHTGNFVVGTPNSYRLTVKNNGTQTTAGTITFKDTIPAGLTFVSAAGTGWLCSNAGAVVTCTSTTPLAVGATSTTITINVNVPGPAGTVTNSATASGGGAVASSTANDVTTIVNPGPAFGNGSITKSHVGNFVVGTNGTYTITPRNTGNLPTTGTVTIRDTLPNGLTFVSGTGTGWACTAAGQIVTCTSTTPIAAGAAGNPITLVVGVGIAALGNVTNTATVSGGGATGTGTANDPTQVDNGARLVAAKSHAGNFTDGLQGVYTLGVSNTGANASSGTITLTDVLPAGLTFVSATGTNWNCTNAGQTVTCTTNAVLAVGAAAPAITLTVLAGPAAVPLVTNTVTPSGGSATFFVPKNDVTAVRGVPRLALTKAHVDPFFAGLPATYTLTPRNTGSAATSGTVTIVDTLPAGLNFVSANGVSWSCSVAGQVVTCTSPAAIAANNNGNSIAITVNPQLSAVPGVTNTATLSGGGAAAPATASDPTTVKIAPVLGISKTHSANFVVGQNGTYTITPVNAGFAPTSGVYTVVDTLPAGLTFVSATGSGWTCNAAGQVVTCTSSTVIPSTSIGQQITLVVAVGTAALPSVSNSASSSGGGAPNTGSSTDVTVVTIPKLAIAKSHTGNFVVGQTGTYTIAVTNSGNATTFGTTTVTDTIPAGLTYASAAGAGWTCTNAGQVVTCTSTAAITAGSAFPSITLGVNVLPAAVPSVTNSATASGGGASGPVTSTDPTVVTAPILAIAKTHTGNFTVGQPGVYTIAVSNTGTAATSGTITVVDPVPAGLTFTSAAGAGWTCTFAAPNVTCTSTTSIAAGAGGNPITLTVGVTMAAVPSVTNSATASGGGASNSPVATNPTNVSGMPVLAIAKSHTGNFTVGQTGLYTIVVSNTGNLNTSGIVTVSDTLPAGLTFVSAAGTGWTCTGTTTVTCTNPTSIAAGASAPAIALQVNVLPAAVPSVTNSATASGGGAPLPATATDPTIVTTPVLSIAKTHAGNFTVGQPGVYTIAVRNTGTAATTGTITVSDPLPAGLTFTSAAGAGWTCTFASPNVSCTSATPIAAGAAGNPIALTVGVTMTAVPAVTNSATASGGGASNSPTATDPTTVSGNPVLAIAKSHNGNFTVGVPGVYTIAVSNTGTVNTAGIVTVSDPLPAGLTFASATGTGWTCTGGATITCTSASVIAAGAAASPITLTVNVLPAAVPALTNTATASGGGSPLPANATDPTVVTTPVLAIAKSHTGNFTVGQPGVYAIAMRNTGTAATSGTISVIDPLPAGLTFTSATGTGWTCTFAAPNVTCTSVTPVAAGASATPITLSVGVLMTATPSVTNSATASGGGASNTPVATDPTAVSGMPVLTIAKSHTGNFTVGVPGVYTIAVSNTGNINTSGTVTVSDTLPAGLTFASAAGTGWTCTGGATVTCTSAAVIAAGGSAPPITLSVNVLPAAVPSVTNSVTAAGGGATTPATANDPTTVLTPVLAIKKSHAGNFTAGQPGVYTIAVSNTGTAATSGTITVADPLPAGLTFTSATGTGWTCSFTSPNVTCTSTTPIAVGAAGNPITLNVGVTMSAVPSVTNTASASGGGASNTPAASDPTTVSGNPVLAIAKSHAGNFTVGQPGVYTIAVSNTGNVNTSGTVTITDTLPAGLTYASATGTGWVCSGGPPVVCTTSAVIAAGAAAPPVTLTVNVLRAAVPSVVNAATASGGGATNPATANDPTTVTAPVLAIKKSHTGNFNVGQTGTFTIAVSNTGTASTSGTVTVVDTLPNGLTYNAASGATWTCNAAGQTVTCTSSAVIAAGAAAAPIALSVNVLPAAIPQVTNLVSASGGGAGNTPNASDPAVVGGQAGIVGPNGKAIDKLVNGQRSVASAPGTTVTYTIAFVNNGNANATNVILTDPFPAGITPIAASVTINGTTAGFTAAVTGQTLVVKIASLVPGVVQTLSVQATVSSTATPGQSFVNVATIAADGIAPIVTNPASVFNGTADIVYDGARGASAPIAGATVTLVDQSSGAPVPVGGANPQTTSATGAFGFTLSPAIYGTPGQSKTYRLTVRAPGYIDRNIGVTFTADPTGLLYNVTLTSLDGQPLATPGGFALVAGPTSIDNVLNLLNNIPMFRSGGLSVNKQADRTTVSVGDRVVFTITIQSSVPALATRVVDQLPAGLAYAPHSATYDGASLEPQVNGRMLVWQLPSLDTAQHVFRYATVVDSGANTGSTLVNMVNVNAQPASGGPVLSGSAQAAVRTVPGTFSDRLTIVGRVVIGSANGGWTSVSRGVAGVRILLEDGTAVVSDAQGRYSFAAVRPGMHVLRLDESSLPKGVHANGTHAYNDPLSTVRLVHTVLDTRLLQDVIFVVEER